MLEFAARHKITPQTQHYSMSQINEAFAALRTPPILAVSMFGEPL